MRSIMKQGGNGLSCVRLSIRPWVCPSALSQLNLKFGPNDNHYYQSNEFLCVSVIRGLRWIISQMRSVSFYTLRAGEIHIMNFFSNCATLVNLKNSPETRIYFLSRPNELAILVYNTSKYMHTVVSMNFPKCVVSPFNKHITHHCHSLDTLLFLCYNLLHFNNMKKLLEITQQIHILHFTHILPMEF